MYCILYVCATLCVCVCYKVYIYNTSLPLFIIKSKTVTVLLPPSNRRLEAEMVAAEQEVKSSQPERSKKWRIASAKQCRLCFKTRMSEGGGHACADCRKRVCGRCGSYSLGKTNWQKVSDCAT